MRVHKLGSDENPATQQDVADKVDEIRKQRKEFNIGIALIGSSDGFSEASKLVILKDSLGECVVVPTTFLFGDKKYLKIQLHKMANDLLDAM